MSTGHKAALARGRAESASVRHYLEALETSKPKRGRKRTPASIDRRLAAIETQLASADVRRGSTCCRSRRTCSTSAPVRTR